MYRNLLVVLALSCFGCVQSPSKTDGTQGVRAYTPEHYRMVVIAKSGHTIEALNIDGSRFNIWIFEMSHSVVQQINRGDMLDSWFEGGEIRLARQGQSIPYINSSFLKSVSE